MLHRALQQFLADVFWGDLDVLLLDLPPGTGDIAISTAQLVPNAELLVVTTPQQAAAEVAERAGSIALQTRQRLAGVVENMSWMELPDGTRMEVFGSGGGQTVADSLTRALGAPVPLLGPDPAGDRSCASAATPAPRSCWPTRTPPRAKALHGDRRQAHHPGPRPGRDEPEHLPGPQVAHHRRRHERTAPSGITLLDGAVRSRSAGQDRALFSAFVQSAEALVDLLRR